MTPFVRQGKPLNDILQSVIFSINSSVSTPSGYSPFEIVYGQRPKFPLASPHDINFNDIPKYSTVYLKQLKKRLDIIRMEVISTIEKSKSEMVSRANNKMSPLDLTIGDYVYLRDEPTGQGQKLQAKFSGPYVVNQIPSPHLIQLRDPTFKKTFPNAGSH